MHTHAGGVAPIVVLKHRALVLTTTMGLGCAHTAADMDGDSAGFALQPGPLNAEADGFNAAVSRRYGAPNKCRTVRFQPACRRPGFGCYTADQPCLGWLG